MTRKTTGTALCGVLGVLVFTAVAFAQNGPRPDFSGYWELRIDGMRVPRAQLTPAAAAAADEQAARDAQSLARCVNIGMPALMDDRSPLDIRQGAKVLGLVAKSQSSTRYIYTDGRMHPERDELEPTTNGHSIGRWEGEALVVDTIGLNDRGLTRIPGGGYRSPSAHLVERYRLLPSGQLSVTFTWEDAAVFQRPHTYEFRYVKVSRIPEPRINECFASDRERASFLVGGAQ